MKQMLKFYVLTVVVAAVAALALSPTAGLEDALADLLALQALALVTGLFVVGIPSLRVDVTTSHFFILVGLATLGPLGAILVGTAGVVGAALGKPARPSPLRLVFNLGGIALASTAASWTFSLTGGQPGQPLAESIGPLLLANLVFLVVNSGLVATAITLDKQLPLATTFRNCFSLIFVPYLAGFTFAAAVLMVFDVSATWALALALPPCWLLVVLYRASSARETARLTDQNA